MEAFGALASTLTSLHQASVDTKGLKGSAGVDMSSHLGCPRYPSHVESKFINQLE